MNPRGHAWPAEGFPTTVHDWAIALLLALVTFAHALVYARNTPTGVPPDEWAHITHVAEIVSGDRWLPDYAGSRIIGSRKGNYLGHPPLYYTTLGLVGRGAGWDPGANVFPFRAVSAAFVALGLLLWIMIARQWGLGWRWTIPICLSVNAVPMFPYLAGSVNNDTLAYLAVALAMFGVASMPRLPRAACYIGGAGVLIALLTKATASLFLLAFFAAWFLATWRARPHALRNLHLLTALGIVVMLGGCYYLYSLAQFGALFPRVGEAHVRSGLPDAPLSLSALVVESLRQMVMRLPAITSHASTVAVTGPLRTAFLLALALPLAAWFGTRLRSRDHPANAVGDAFMIALVVTMTVHLFVVWRGYAVYGLLTGLQPRYYAYALPGFLMICFARNDHLRVSRWLLAVAATAWAGMLLVIPSLSLQAEAKRHSVLPAITRLSLATGDKVKVLAVAEPGERDAGHVDVVERTGDVVRVRGWAIDVEAAQGASRVIVHYSVRRVGTAATGFPRPDVAQTLDSAGAGTSGFELELFDAPSDFDPCDLELMAEQEDGQPVRLRHDSCDLRG